MLFALLKDGPVLRRRLLGIVPNRYFEFGMNVIYKADAHLGGYLRGQAVIAVLVGASTALGLGLVGVDYYLVLGLVTGVANLVPYVGFVVSAGLSIAVSVVTTGDVNQAVGVLAVFGRAPDGRERRLSAVDHGQERVDGPGARAARHPDRWARRGRSGDGAGRSRPRPCSK